MTPDLSRDLHDPADDYLGVLLQQGRPLTDADWNDLVSQLTRRLHVGSYDTFGPAVVPEQSPDAFAIVPGGGGFTIGPGRIYVDGLLAQNHGAGARVWDPHLAEQNGRDPVAYGDQPYLPQPPALPAPPYIVQLDVWRREVDHLQDPALLETAIGVDTTARLQTVWQVRAIEVPAGTDCGTPLDGVAAWQAAIAPSAGRLTTATGDVAGEPDPCLVPPAGGYKGGENQLYRVQVHAGGVPGTATFKWSRDNGSVQSLVQRIADATHVVVASTGKDEVLRFSDGDWVELLDDRHQLRGEPGVLRRIAIGGGVDDGTRTITLATPLAAADFPVDGQGVPTGGWHLRMRRWDQQGAVRRADGTTWQDLDAGGATGEITIPADGTQLLLENGVLVSFGVAVPGGRFHVGDWWVFAARSGDASLEILQAAPPRGVHHHHAKLAVVTGPGTVDDCRQFWPPGGGCCTVVVRPGQDIQAAIDSLPDAGGCVCLKAGLHEIRQALRIDRSRVVLHGEAPGVRVRGTGLDRLLDVDGAQGWIEDVEVTHIDFELARVNPNAMQLPILATLAFGTRLQVHDCGLRYSGPLFADDGALVQVTGLAVGNAGDVAVRGNDVQGCYLGVLAAGAVNGLAVADNTLRCGTAEDGTLLARWAVRLGEGVRADCRQNQVEGYRTGFQVLQGAAACTVADNRIVRRLQPNAQGQAAADDAYWAIELAADQGRAEGNDIDLGAPDQGGVRVSGRAAIVAHNRLRSGVRRANPFAGPYGIYVGASSAAATGRGNRALVEGNRMSGDQIALVAGYATDLRIAGNDVSGNERSGLGMWLAFLQGAQVEGNRLDDLLLPMLLTECVRSRVGGNHLHRSGGGVVMNGETDLDFSDNTIENIGGLGIRVNRIGGQMRLRGNRLSCCGYGLDVTAVAIFAMDNQRDTRLSIESCEILDTGLSPDRAQFTSGRAIGIGTAGIADMLVAHSHVAYRPGDNPLDPALEHRALLAFGTLASTFATGARLVTISFGGLQALGNHFLGPGRTNLVEVPRLPVSSAPGVEFDIRFEKLVFAGNRLDHTQGVPNDNIGGTALLFATHPAVQGNQVKGPDGMPSFNLAGRPRVALTGNVSTGGYLGVNNPVPTPHTSFNVIL